jgi:hypothetical protein
MGLKEVENIYRKFISTYIQVYNIQRHSGCSYLVVRTATMLMLLMVGN